MTAFLSNVFNDPSNPWYYVVGVLFLVLIFGALAVYIILTNKKNKKAEENPETQANKDEQTGTETEINNDTAQESVSEESKESKE